MKDNFWVEESNLQSTVCKKRKRRVGKRKLEFVGWGSRPIIEFLEAIGQDSARKHSQQEVASLIRKYINDKGLASAEKKKKVLCDERLYALFGKKSMLRTKVYDMLEEHFAENHDDSDDDDDELLDSTDEDYGEKKPFELRNFPLGQTKKVFKTPKSCFAAIIPENIKLIYLKRSVIQDLAKFPESFEFKVVGSFVRLKSDPNDIFQKNRFQLLQVTGVHEVSVSDGADTETYLRLSNFLKDVSISMLSDDNFTEKMDNDGLKCAIDHILDAEQKGEISEDNVLYIVENINVAAIETTFWSVEWGIAELVNNPWIQRKVGEEMDRVLGAGVPLTEPDTHKLPYLEAVIKELYAFEWRSPFSYHT